VRYYARIGEREVECRLEAVHGAVFVTVEGRRFQADLQRVPHSDSFSLLLDGRSYEFTLHENEIGFELSGGAGRFQVSVEAARSHAARLATGAARGASGPKRITAAMPGIVREVLVAEGAAVQKGAPLLILEAMKMQNEIRADRDGTVCAVHAAAGQTVEKGANLVEIE